jgi:hypothetical protein
LKKFHDKIAMDIRKGGNGLTTFQDEEKGTSMKVRVRVS